MVDQDLQTHADARNLLRLVNGHQIEPLGECDNLLQIARSEQMADSDIVPRFQTVAQTAGSKIRFEKGRFAGPAWPVYDQRLAGHER